MQGSPSSRVLAQCGPAHLVEDGPLLHFTGTASDTMGTLSMVLGILSLNTVGWAIVSLALLFGGSGSVLLCLLTFTLAGATCGGLALALSSRRRKLAAPGPVLLTVDRARDQVLVGGTPVCRIRDARFVAAFQLTSSSRALRVDSPAGQLVVARGVAGISSIRSMVNALRQRNLPVT